MRVTDFEIVDGTIVNAEAGVIFVREGEEWRLQNAFLFTAEERQRLTAMARQAFARSFLPPVASARARPPRMRPPPRSRRRSTP